MVSFSENNPFGIAQIGHKQFVIYHQGKESAGSDIGQPPKAQFVVGFHHLYKHLLYLLESLNDALLNQILGSEIQVFLQNFLKVILNELGFLSYTLASLRGRPKPTQKIPFGPPTDHIILGPLLVRWHYVGNTLLSLLCSS